MPDINFDQLSSIASPISTAAKILKWISDRFSITKILLSVLSFIIMGVIIAGGAYLTFKTFMINQEQIISDFTAIGEANLYYYEGTNDVPEVNQ